MKLIPKINLNFHLNFWDKISFSKVEQANNVLIINHMAEFNIKIK